MLLRFIAHRLQPSARTGHLVSLAMTVLWSTSLLSCKPAPKRDTTQPPAGGQETKNDGGGNGQGNTQDGTDDTPNPQQNQTTNPQGTNQNQQGPQTTQPNVSPNGGGSPATGTIRVTPKFINSTAWWKNCLKLTLNGTTEVDIGCNKKEGATKLATENVATDLKDGIKTDADNLILVKFDTWENQAGSCQAGKPCEGPYPGPPRLRHTKTAPHVFRCYSVQADANDLKNKRILLYFEDQIDDRIAHDDYLRRTVFAQASAQGSINPLAKIPALNTTYQLNSGKTVTQGRCNPITAPYTEEGLQRACGINFLDYIIEIQASQIAVSIDGLTCPHHPL